MRIKQTHGDLCVQASVSLHEADAHWSAQLKQALCISTADCVPILIADTKTKNILSIHAGWRGIANRIIPKSIDQLKKHNSDPKNLYIMIGPHIQFSSFEVEKPVFDEIIGSVKIDKDYIPEISKAHGQNKFNINLDAIIQIQLSEYDIQPDQINSLSIDTKTNLQFNSFRRDKEKSGRQTSFVACHF